MRISTQLLAAILGITVLTQVVYGGIAFWITLDAGRQARVRYLDHLATDLARGAEGPVITGRRFEQGLDALAPGEGLVLVYDRAARDIVVQSPDDEHARRMARQLAAADLASAVGDGPVRQADIADQSFLWGGAAIPGTEYRLVLAEPAMAETRRIVSTLGYRLLTSGIGVLWVAVWVAMLLASMIARRLREKNLALEHQALHDMLTGLPNRTLLGDRLLQAQHQANRDGGSFALLVMDLDNFKEVNDTLGHQFGDRLLREVAGRIQDSIRETDTVARLGGDEFALLLPDIAVEQASECVARILSRLEQPVSIDGIRVAVGASVGVAMYPGDGDDVERLLAHADMAMYRAKRAQGYAIYDSGQDTSSVRRLQLMGDLRKAISTGELQVWYQPMVDLRYRRTVAVEALARWPHAGLGFVPPDEFIPLAEQTGMIRMLTLWVLQQAVSQCVDWRRRGIDIMVSVNLSTHCLRDASFCGELAVLLNHSGLPADRLLLEITESALMQNVGYAQDMLKQLHETGVRLAIDDFGTGFSSLAYLKQLPVDRLKIDKSFVLDMVSDGNNAAIVKSVISLAHNMGHEVVAEGVEDAHTLDMLQRFGCDVVQGFYLGRPAAAAELETWLKQSRWGVGGVRAQAPVRRWGA